MKNKGKSAPESQVINAFAKLGAAINSGDIDKIKRSYGAAYKKLKPFLKRFTFYRRFNELANQAAQKIAHELLNLN